MRRRRSIRGCVRPSIHRSVHRSVRRSGTPSLRRLLGASYAEYSALFFKLELKRNGVSYARNINGHSIKFEENLLSLSSEMVFKKTIGSNLGMMLNIVPNLIVTKKREI